MQAMRSGAVASTHLDGRRGLELISAGGETSVTDSDTFHASWRDVQAGGIAVGEWSTSPLSGALPVASNAPAAVLILMAEGSLQYWIGPHLTEAKPGTVHILAGTDRLRFLIPAPTRLYRIIAPAAILPITVRDLINSSTGQVARTLLTNGLLSVIEALLDPAAGGPNSPASRVVRPLTIATLEDLAPDTAPPDPRAQLVTYIEQHLTDPDLGPQSIASAFAISVRWVHRLFDIDGESVARYIRNRRVDQVAAQLQTGNALPPLESLAKQNGFPTRDQLNRSFKARYGLSISEYAHRTLRGDPPQPCTATSP